MAWLKPKHGRKCVGLIFTLATIGPAIAVAQTDDTFPNRAIRIIVPYQPGGATDISARVVSTRLPEVIGQPVIVENRPGAGGNIGVEAVATMAADGYTLLIGNVSTNAINETVYATSLRTKASRDLVGVTNVSEIPHVLVVNWQSSSKTLADVIAQAKAQPGKLNYASTGAGGYPHLDILRLEKATGVLMTHIPYNGGAGPLVRALLANEVHVSFLNLASALPHIKAGKLRPLAATTPTRLPDLAEVPTMTELGYAGIGTTAWQGLFAPAATPPAVLDKLHSAIVKALAAPELKEQLAKQGLNLVLSKSPQEYTEFTRAETKRWAEFLAQNPVKVE